MNFKDAADAFEELEVIVKKPNSEMSVKQFADACSHFFLVFTILRNTFRFAEIDFLAKVKDLDEASRSVLTLEAMVDNDIEANRVTNSVMDVYSHTRNLLMVKRGLEFIKVLCEELLSTEADTPLKDSASKAYDQVFAPYHGYHIRNAAATGFDYLPSKDQLFGMFTEPVETTKIHIQSYVSASASVIAYLDNLFVSKNLGTNY